ncbi:hypothetical protein FNH22_11265 [Fulvivirga sp. M361]|uniref:hypothetical protein n=1 Tax=Fulvivirga sp. M361 TaxID=2594266 RepID=UPI001179D6D0|nr:hypothetical protein [Fulvivirga sp. M361]TRX59095.1 hypothetical protein FNH22_11265 [Fulvivirga sp. M361]
MELIKITNKGATGNLFVGHEEVLFVDWNNGNKEGFYAIDKSLALRQVDKVYFALNTIGAHYPVIENQLPFAIENYVTTPGPDGEVYCSYYQESSVYGFDKTGKKIFEWKDHIGQGHALHDIRFQPPHFLWLAFPTGQTVTKLSLIDKKETFRIGNYNWNYDRYEPLSYPESLWIDEHFLYIPNMGNHKIYKLDLNNYQLSEEVTLNEQPWQYLKCTIGTFIVSGTGIYQVIN